MRLRPLLLGLVATGAVGSLLVSPPQQTCIAFSPFANSSRPLLALHLAPAREADDAAALARQHGLAAVSAALAAAIRFSRAQDSNAGTKPMPARVRRALAPYFPSDTLDRVRWTTAGQRVSLAALLAGWHRQDGAMTLDEVIVFTNPRAARHVELWAHELTHVRQYEALGLDAFAHCYALDWRALERQARINAARIIRDRERRTLVQA